MADFSHLKKLEQDGSTERKYTFDQIEGAPSLWSRPATNANKAFQNETLRRANARAGLNRRAKRVTAEVLAQSRDEDREVLSKCCVTRWDVTDANGEPVEFTEENCLEFFRALPDWLFDDFRAWATDAGNFLAADTVEGGRELGEV